MIAYNAQIWHVPLGFQISVMFLCCVSLSDNSGEACGISFVMRHSKICPAFLNALQQDTCKHLLRRHGQVSVKVFDYLAKQVAIVIPLTAPSMRRTRCKRKVEVLALFNQFLS